MLLPATYRTIPAIVVVTFAIASALAQDAVPVPDTFEVASVKPGKAGSGTTYGTRGGGVFYASNITVLALVRLAYGVQDFQIEKAPSWLTSERFDIQAKADREWPGSSPTSAPATLAAMLRSLLRDRFAFESTWERRRGMVLALVRNGATLGRNITPSTSDCVSTANRPVSAQQKCGTFLRTGMISAANVTMADLVAMLSRVAATNVVDATGLDGRFDVELTYRPESLGGDTVVSPSPGDPPTLSVALKEQLGLGLIQQEDSVDVLVVTRVERPTPN